MENKVNRTPVAIGDIVDEGWIISKVSEKCYC